VIVVTADTNIYVSGLHFGGLPRAFLEHARAGAFRLAMSGPILSLKFGWASEEIHVALANFDQCRLQVEPDEMLDVVPDDHDDNRILECAVAARSDFIVSGDNHLLRLGVFRGIRIMTVAEFMLLLPTL
jgi:predicted nucleic acid-binding protein